MRSEKSSLTELKINKLNTLNFDWGSHIDTQATWDSHYTKMLIFYDQNGHSNVPTKFKDDTALGQFISTQRSEYKKYIQGKKSKLNQDKINRLNKIAFQWALLPQNSQE